jgi:hypothetical protein
MRDSMMMNHKEEEVVVAASKQRSQGEEGADMNQMSK